MKQTTLHLHTSFTIDQVDPRIYGGFLEHLGRAVYGGVYEPGSPHADAEGLRTDVLEELKPLGFTAMRYPGGNFVSGYDWLDGVGPKENRPTKLDLAWQSLDSNQFGTNEFMSLARRMGWTPMMAVNLGTGAPAEARNWLEYCNGAGGAYWSDLRREHGYEEPHNIKLWCLGNEMDGPWQIGHVPARDYAIRAQQTARLMKMFDPEVELVACGSCAPELKTYLEWDYEVLDYLHRDVDYISLHRYVGNPENDSAEFLNSGLSIDQQIEELDAVCAAIQGKAKTKHRVKLSFDEWNVWYRARHGEHLDGRGKHAPPLLEEHYNLEDALVVAQFLNSFIRHADSVKIANLAQIVNVIAPLLTTTDAVLRQTIYHPIAMIRSRGEGTALRVHTEGPKTPSKLFPNAPQIDASAILDGERLHVFAVNRSLAEGSELEIRLSGRGFAGIESGEIISGTDPKAVNEFGRPEAVQAVEMKDACIEGGQARVKLPALSFWAGTFRLG